MLDVLLVDADGDVRVKWSAFLRQAGLTVDSSPNAVAALRRLDRGPVLVVMCDETFQGPSGTVLLETVRRRFPHAGRVLFTHMQGLETQALRAGALLLSKRDRPGDVRRAIIAEVQDAERRHQGSL